jgi:hypothetical protein
MNKAHVYFNSIFNSLQFIEYNEIGNCPYYNQTVDGVERAIGE